MVKNIGHNAARAYTLKDGLLAALSVPYDVVFLDVNLPDENGLEALAKILEVQPAPEVVIRTGAEMAIRHGAWDYTQKPLSPEIIMFLLNGAPVFVGSCCSIRWEHEGGLPHIRTLPFPPV